MSQQSQTESTFPSWIEANLEKDFHFNKYLCKGAELEWAKRLGLTTEQVSVWFENRRKKHEREMALRPKVVPPPPQPLVVITDPRIAELELEKEFHFNSCIWENRVDEFATKFSMTADQVRSWFKNRRELEREGWQMINPWDVSSDDESSLKRSLKSTRGIPRPHKLFPRP